MHNFFFYPPANKAEDIHTLVPLHEIEYNTTEGGEFLDDAIRTEDLPPIYSEENIAPGSPENLL
ncbi:MAG: hypothetical protein J7497_10920 [Chitinophagaceae bacterium]|nr:hypothetical protein [Chitinophagaceae bacterium]